MTSNCSGLSQFYGNITFSQEGDITLKQAQDYVKANKMEATASDPIKMHEECYLMGNITDNNNQSLTDFYKTSSMMADLNTLVNESEAANANVCGSGSYIYSDTDPSTGKITEKCQTCGQSPPDKDNDIDYNINNSILTDSEQYAEIMLQVEKESENIRLGNIQERGLKDFEQDYTMYRYGIYDQETLEAVADDGLLKEGPIKEGAIAIREEYGQDTTPPGKLDEATFTDVQKQCSPLISDWFYSQHQRNMNSERAQIFDTYAIDDKVYRGFDLLSDGTIMEFFDREYNNVLDIGGYDGDTITATQLEENGKDSIIDKIRILEIDGDTTRNASYRERLRPCAAGDSAICASFGDSENTYYKTIPEELARAWIAKKLDSIKKKSPPTQDGNISTAYGNLGKMMNDVTPQIETCINDVVGTEKNGKKSIERLKEAGGDFTKLDTEDIQYLRRKIVAFIHSPDAKMNECVQLLYAQGADLCTEGLYTKTMKILSVLFALLGVNVDLSDVETDDDKYNSVMNFINSLGDLFPRATEKIIRIIQGMEMDLCNSTRQSDIIVNLYDDVVNKNRKYNIEMGILGHLFSLDENHYSRIVQTYNMISPVLGRLFGPSAE